MALLDRTGKEVTFTLLGVGCLLFLYYVGARDFWPTDEDEYGQISREMLRSGNWLIPTANGEAWTIKPVLLNWLIALIAMPFGDVTEFHARFFSSMGALGSFMLTFFLGKRMFATRAGILSALALGTSAVFLQQSRWAQTYMLSTFFSTLAIACFYVGYTCPEKRKPAYLLMYVSVALGVLTMGPVNLAVPGLVCFTFLVFSRDLWHMKEMMLVRGTLLFLAIAAPWYIMMAGQEEYGFDLIVTTNLTRYVNAWTHSQPFYFYVRDIIWSFAPWSFLIPGALVLAFSNRSSEHRQGIRLVLVWFFSLLIFFSISDGKRAQYLLSAYPAMALLVGYLMHRALEGWHETFYRRAIVIPSLILAATWVLIAIAAPILAFKRSEEYLLPVLGVSAVAIVFAILMITAWRKDRPQQLVVMPFAFVLVLVLYSVHFIIPLVDREKTVKPYSEGISKLLADNPGTAWGMYRSYRARFIYYADRFTKNLMDEESLRDFLAQPGPVLVVVRGRDYDALKSGLLAELTVLDRRQIGSRDLVLASRQVDNLVSLSALPDARGPK